MKNNGTATAADIELHEQIRMESIAAAEWLTRNADSVTDTEISMLEDSGMLAIACSAHGADYRTVEKVQKVLEEREDVNTGDAEEVEVEETGEDEAEEKAYTDLIEFLKSIGIDETEIPDQITIEWLREIARTYNLWNPEVMYQHPNSQYYYAFINDKELISRLLSENAGIGQVNILLHELKCNTILDGLNISLDFTTETKKNKLLMKFGTSDLGLLIIKKIVKYWLGVSNHPPKRNTILRLIDFHAILRK